MTSPVLMVVDDDPDSLGTLAEVLRRRYDRDYVVISDSSAVKEFVMAAGARLRTTG